MNFREILEEKVNENEKRIPAKYDKAVIKFQDQLEKFQTTLMDIEEDLGSEHPSLERMLGLKFEKVMKEFKKNVEEVHTYLRKL